MQPGELVVARIKGGAAVVQYVASAARKGHVRLTVGRNRQAEIPADRVLLATGVTASSQEEAEEFRRRCEQLAAAIDLSEVWEVAADQLSPVHLKDLAELYWGASPDAAHRAALLLHLDRESLYFTSDKEGYVPQSRASVQEAQTRRQREAEREQAASSLAAHLAQSKLPQPMGAYESSLLVHLRGYAVHGDSYTRSAAARNLLERVGSNTRDLQQLSFDLLVKAGLLSPDEPLELERAGIAQQFPKDVLDAAFKLELSRFLEEPWRRDLTAGPTITIDDADTEDRDDALSLEIQPQQEAGAGPVFRIGIHVADGGSLIPPGSALDQEADRRMASLYLPERKVPMLPPEVSALKGSLLPGEKRVALSLLARVTRSGEVLDWEVTPSVVRSQAALSYDEADQAAGDASHPWHLVVTSLGEIAQRLRQKRLDAGAISIERPEMLIKIAAAGEVEVRVLSRASPARQLVAELMILCNSLLAEFCRRQGLPAAYRSQAAPDLGDIPSGIPEGALRQYLVMRRLLPAGLDVIPAPHAGLGVTAYIQASSPLRRYPDLVMQRQISYFLRAGKSLYSAEQVASVAQRAEVQLKELSSIEEERKRYWFLKYLKQLLPAGQEQDGGRLFEAVVLENQPGRPALLELADFPYRVRADIQKSCLPGNTVILQLHGVDLWRRAGYFVQEQQPRPRPS